jgi:hypothetical protein
MKAIAGIDIGVWDAKAQALGWRGRRCLYRTGRWDREFADSPLEEAVMSELVSVGNSLLEANLQGISLDSATP